MRRSVPLIIGLVLAGLFALMDVIPLPAGDGEHPPVAVVIAGAVLGLITLVGIVPAWRGSRAGVVAVIVTRLLSALTAVPAFFVEGVPGPAVGAAAAGIVLTLVCVALLAPALRSNA